MILASILVNAKFIERVNRYLGLVNIDNKPIEVFIPNPGRMKELLLPNTPIKLRPVHNKNRKTAYDLVLVSHNNDWVCIDSGIPNKLLYDCLIKKEIEEFKNYTYIKKEYPYLNSRFDFFLSGNTKPCFIEAKSCTLMVNNVALFPDAPTKRGSKHLYHLVDAFKNGYNAYVVVIIQREGAKIFSPNRNTDPNFANAMKFAVKEGVKVMAFSTKIKDNEIVITKSIRTRLE